MHAKMDKQFGKEEMLFAQLTHLVSIQCQLNTVADNLEKFIANTDEKTLELTASLLHSQTQGQIFETIGNIDNCVNSLVSVGYSKFDHDFFAFGS